MADDAGALLVRSGLVSSSALDDARSKVAAAGGTVGEQLVAAGQLSDDTLTAFYKQRLLVPQVHPNVLARLSETIVGTLPSELAIELRAIPVSVDAENNLTIAMSDPSDRRAVDRIAVATGSYVVRAVATQMQIAWCLAHYYGHITDLGARLLQPAAEEAEPEPAPEPVAAAREPEPEPESDPEPEPEPEDTEPEPDAIPEPLPAHAPRSRTASGEIRIHARAASIKPPILDDESGPIIAIEESVPDDDDDEPEDLPREESGPVITMEVGDDTSPAATPAPRRRTPAEPDPPELFARGGEIASVAHDAPAIEHDGPNVVIDFGRAPEPEPEPEPEPDDDEPAMIRDAPRADDTPPAGRSPVEVHDEPSVPILLDRRRPSNPPEIAAPPAGNPRASKPGRADRRTAVGLGAVGMRRLSRDTAAEDLPAALEDEDTREHVIAGGDGDPTRLELRAAPPSDDISSDDHLAAPPSPLHDDDTSPLVRPPPPRSAPSESGRIRMTNVKPRAQIEEDDEEAEEPVPVRRSHPTRVMSTTELDAAIPGRRADLLPAHIVDDLDDGWGPPGSTIPPPLLGSIPGTDDDGGHSIPLPNLEHKPLIVAPPSPPEHGRPHTQTEAGVARMLEEATMRVLELIHRLESAPDRNAVVETMIDHLAESHRRAGFFAARAGELSLFEITPAMPALPNATLRLDRPSTFADVVGTRLPYRGPMHDGASRAFLQAVLGAPPAEILLVPITVRDRVVGVLFGEHRLRHTFDDQLALAGRAAGNALERILKAKRGGE